MSSTYQALQTNAAYIPREDVSVLRLTGADRMDFIQRQSTNDLNQLSPQQAVITILTSATARILDVLTIIPQPESYLLVCLPGRAEATFNYLKGRIFFMDKVTLTMETDLSVIDVVGPQASEHLDHTPAEGNLMTHGDTAILRLAGYGGTYFRIVTPALPTGWGIPQADSTELEWLRIKTGQPGPTSELTEDFTPLEVGYGAYVSDTKGCYTGQEIIARQITYDKVAKTLGRVHAQAPFAVGDEVFAGDQKLGQVTSYAHIPDEGHIGLVMLRTRHLDDDDNPEDVTIGSGVEAQLVI